jgi:hypothetical protein
MHDKVEIVYFKINEKQYFCNYKISENIRSIYKKNCFTKERRKYCTYILVYLLVEVK